MNLLISGPSILAEPLTAPRAAIAGTATELDLEEPLLGDIALAGDAEELSICIWTGLSQSRGPRHDLPHPPEVDSILSRH